MNLEAVVRHYRANFQHNSHEEIESFRNEPTLEAAVRRASLAESSDGKRYSHQRRLKRADLERAADALGKKLGPLGEQTNFARLFEVVEATVRVERGLGSLYVYDTALRIGAKLGHLPTRVYLHAGARAGALALGLDAAKRRALDQGELPPELRILEMHEVEDVFCIYKQHFTGTVPDVDDARACWADDADEAD